MRIKMLRTRSRCEMREQGTEHGHGGKRGGDAYKDRLQIGILAQTRRVCGAKENERAFPQVKRGVAHVQHGAALLGVQKGIAVRFLDTVCGKKACRGDLLCHFSAPLSTMIIPKGRKIVNKNRARKAIVCITHARSCIALRRVLC